MPTIPNDDDDGDFFPVDDGFGSDNAPSDPPVRGNPNDGLGGKSKAPPFFHPPGSQATPRGQPQPARQPTPARQVTPRAQPQPERQATPQYPGIRFTPINAPSPKPFSSLG